MLRFSLLAWLLNSGFCTQNPFLPFLLPTYIWKAYKDNSHSCVASSGYDIPNEMDSVGTRQGTSRWGLASKVRTGWLILEAGIHIPGPGDQICGCQEVVVLTTVEAAGAALSRSQHCSGDAALDQSDFCSSGPSMDFASTCCSVWNLSA